MKWNHIRLAEEHILALFKEAENEFKKHPERSNRYVKLARRIAMKFQIKLPIELKRKFCKHCNAFLKPGMNCRIRINKSRVIYYCFKCKKYMRFNLH
ncbi:ribonuclease P [Candidatus Woesearchaeota archaeon]|nr:ribonuclease P [Candidatus Woesearchaeota archaeon]